MGTWTSTTYERHDGSIHLSCAETAKLIRKALKRAFPTTKFSVRSSSYSGGASVSISWTDGPTGRQVDAVTGVYAGADFDGMIDLKTHNDHWLEPDGTSTIAKREGTTGSFEGYVTDPPTANSRLVSFGADFVQTHRRLSPEVEARIEQEIADYIGEPFPKASEHSAMLPISTFKLDGGGVGLARDPQGGTWASSAVWQIGCQRDYSKPCECPADARYVAGGRDRCGKCGA
jgi:Large polyvalent protein associated domain 29